MKTIKTMILMAALTLAWGCSSDSDDNQQWRGSVFALSVKPTWAIDWSSDVAQPNWQAPAPTKYECSMHLLIRLSDELSGHSTDDDQMAVFIGDECRGVSSRNLLSDGKVAFLLHVKASSEETGQPMELRYYCGGIHHLNKMQLEVPFTPNNFFQPYKQDLAISDGSTKYPVVSQLTVTLPLQLPFTVNSRDQLAVFVDNECRGVGERDAENPDQWHITVCGVQAGETAQIRYYSTEKRGTFTIQESIQLTGKPQEVYISF
ncbi:hypothetical protein [Xylanibacter brevis]|uniref:hypothetical protein n=1 Tax=Xylanibacter brevis TaxID=83231 RepID=UPI0004881705|nr:hypothetical protein [Xylanibacter brevis]